MLVKKKIQLLILLLFVGCLATPSGDDDPDCASGEVFNHIKRRCEAGALAPQPSLRSISVNEDEETSITLTYTDVNSGQANDCSVTNVLDQNLDVYSPIAFQAPTKAALAAQAARQVANVALDPDIATAATNAENMALDVQNAETHFQLVAALEQVVKETKDAGDKAQLETNATTQLLGREAQLKASELAEITHYVSNRCYCQGGTCSTKVKSAINHNGSSGFSYTLSDAQDGTSDPVEVAITIVPINDPPIPSNYSIYDPFTLNFYNESANPNASSYYFTVPLASDVDADDALYAEFFTYEVVEGPSSGTLSDCMGLNGSLYTDRDCIYTPNDGDLSKVGEPAEGIEQGIWFVAAAAGSWGNSITVAMVHKAGVGQSPYTVVNGLDLTIYIENNVTRISDVLNHFAGNPQVHSILNVPTNIYNMGSCLNPALTDAATATQLKCSTLASIVPVPSFNDTLVATERFNLTSGDDGLDRIVYRVYDGQSHSTAFGYIDISLFNSSDSAVIDLDSLLPLVTNEDTPIEVTIPWSDAEGTDVLAGQAGCEIKPFAAYEASFDVRRKCSCDDHDADPTTPKICTFNVAPIQHFNGTINDLYIQLHSVDNSSGYYHIPITVNPVNDAAFPAFFNVLLTESETSSAPEYPFSIPAALDVDIPEDSINYTVITEPLNGEVRDCLGRNGSASNDLDCVYVPANGNLNGDGIAASRIIQNLKIEAVFDGIRGEDIFIEYANDIHMDAGDIRIENNQLDIKVSFLSNTVTATELAAAINDPAYNVFVPMMIKATVEGANGALMQTSSPRINLVSGVDGMDFFEYLVDDGNTNASDRIQGHVNFNVASTNDKPTMCEYSKYNEAPECGLNGCIGVDSPYARLAPNTSGIVFYHITEAVCYKSNGTSVTDWEVMDSYISDQYLNEKDKVVIDEIKVDEGGGDSSEDGETITINSVTSSDSVLIPIQNIKFYFDDTDINNVIAPYYPIFFGDAVESEDERDFRIEITPVGGLAGESTIEIEFWDSNAQAKKGTVSFKVTVNPVSVTHQGWKHIKAIGPKVNKHSRVLDREYVCSYSQTKCSVLGNSGKECTGAGDPTALGYQADEHLSVYYDSNSKDCYYATGTGSGTSWTKYQAYCAVSPSDHANECLNIGASCIGDSAPTIVPTKLNHFYYDRLSKTCYRSKDTNSSADWEVYQGPGEVTLSWEDFLISGNGSITGFNVYRRLSNESFDYDTPVNRETITASLDSYVDNEVNSIYPPIPNTVYFYEVRPIINSIPTDSNEVFKTIRVTVPNNNMSFVHRWMANKTMCDLLHSTDIDPTNNYRCPYIGPGDRSGYYDIGEDLIVDRYEVSCNYSPSPTCDTAEGSCIGNVDPEFTVNAAQNSIYYNRNNGKCYVNVDGLASWTEITELHATIMNKTNIPENPPLVYMSQLQAAHYCARSNVLPDILGVTQDLERHLPTRRQQIAYSQWNRDENNDTTITNTETGLSMNSSSKCNASNASGLSQFFSDTQIPDSNTFYSLPGTEESDIRSVMTGSYGAVYGTYGTEMCQSKFDIQDTVGNVAEWVMDRVTCTTPANCSGVRAGDGNEIVADPAIALMGTNNDLSPSAPYLGTGYPVFGLGNSAGANSIVGPCSDTNADDICDASFSEWKFEEERYDSGRFVVPMGLPVFEDYPLYNEDDTINDYLFEIGPTSGITSAQLHDDAMGLNTGTIFSDANNCGAMATGGSYLSGSDAGTYSFELVPCTDDVPTVAKAHLTLGDISFKSTSTAGANIWILLQDTGALGATPTDAVVGGAGLTGVVVSMGTDASGDINATAQDIVDAINNNPDLAAFVRAEVSGNPTRVQSALTEAIFLNAVTSDSKRVDIGFRCITPLTGYDE
jgi:hypothetical protein